MKASAESAGAKSPANPPGAGRIHFHTFGGWKPERLPLQPRIRFVGRTGRALVLGLKP